MQLYFSPSHHPTSSNCFLFAGLKQKYEHPPSLTLFIATSATTTFPHMELSSLCWKIVWITRWINTHFFNKPESVWITRWIDTRYVQVFKAQSYRISSEGLCNEYRRLRNVCNSNLQCFEKKHLSPSVSCFILLPTPFILRVNIQHVLLFSNHSLR